MAAISYWNEARVNSNARLQFEINISTIFLHCFFYKSIMGSRVIDWIYRLEGNEKWEI